MEIVICSSERMGIQGDHGSIRVPAHIRTLNSIRLNSIITFKTKDNDAVALQVKKAFLSDTHANGSASFVAPAVLETLDLTQVLLPQEITAPEITMGCDPEFFLTTETGGIYSAGAFFNKTGEIGHDGVLCELRPFPDVDPRQVTNTLRALLSRVRHYIPPNLNLTGSSCYNGMSAGFHVHLGIPASLLKSGLTPYILKYITRVLDFYVGTVTTLSETGPDEEKRRTSPGVQYGKVGDYRCTLRTLEYRVPGGAMLKAPELTEGLLTLSKLVARDAIGRLLAQTKELADVNGLPFVDEATREMYPNILSGDELKAVIEGNNVKQLKTIAKIVKADVRDMINYPMHAEAVERMFRCLEETRTNNITTNWNL